MVNVCLYIDIEIKLYIYIALSINFFSAFSQNDEADDDIREGGMNVQNPNKAILGIKGTYIDEK